VQFGALGSSVEHGIVVDAKGASIGEQSEKDEK
jgi:hypothetical protein